jgi:hypothetical protein
MPSSYSPLLRLEEIGAGEQSGLWGDTTNKNLGDLVEQAIAGVTTIALTGPAGDYTLSALNGAVDESRSAVLSFIGSPSGAKNIIIPTSTKLYVVRNSSGQTITVKTLAQVTGVTILNGEATLVFCNGTNAVAGIATAGVGPTTVANGGTGATSFSGGFVKSPGGTGILTSSSTVSLTSEVSGTLPVSSGGTGATTFATGNVLLGNGGSALTPLAGVSSGQGLIWSGTAWAPNTTVNTVTGGTGISIGGTAAAPIINLSSTLTPGTFTNATVSVSGSGVITAVSSGAGAGVSTITGSNIGVSPSTGNVTITLSGSNVNSALGFTPADSSSLANYALLSGATFSSTIASTQFNVTGGGFMTTNSIQVGSSSGQGVINSGGTVGLITSNAAFGLNITPSNTVTTTAVDAFKNGSSTAWIISSDARIKDNVQPYVKGLSELTQINPKVWTYNGKAGSTLGATGIGVIADEVEQVFPSIVGSRKGKLNKDDEQDTDIKNVDVSELTWLLINAVKQLNAKVDAQAAEIAALKAN